MNADKLFTLWWLMFGSRFEEKLGYRPTKKEVARYAFEAGIKAGQNPMSMEEV